MKYKKPDLGNFTYEPAMSFEEIAKLLNISSQGVLEIYQRALGKLIKTYRV